MPWPVAVGSSSNMDIRKTKGSNSAETTPERWQLAWGTRAGKATLFTQVPRAFVR